METITQLNVLASIHKASVHVLFSEHTKDWCCIFRSEQPGEKIELLERNAGLSMAVGMVYQRVLALSSQGMKSLTTPQLSYYEPPTEPSPYLDELPY